MAGNTHHRRSISFKPFFYLCLSGSSVTIFGMVQSPYGWGDTPGTRREDDTSPKRKRGFDLPSLALRACMPELLPDVESCPEPDRPANRRRYLLSVGVEPACSCTLKKRSSALLSMA